MVLVMANQPNRVPTGLPYGQGEQLAQMQKVAPIPQTSAPQPSTGVASAAGPRRDTQYAPPVVPLDAPSFRPNEHVMDGVDAGPGRSAGEAGVPTHDDGSVDATSAALRGIYAATGYSGLLAVLQQLEGTHDTGGLSDLRFAHGRWDDPIDPPIRHGGMFDPSAPLDPSQVNDQRVETAGALAVNAGLGVGVAAGQVASDNPAALGMRDENTATSRTGPPPPPEPQMRMKGPR